MGGCVHCHTRIRGVYHRPHVVVVGPSGYEPPPFCDSCGAAHPWATIEQRIYELENILDEETDIDEVDRVVISGHLAQLRQLEAGSDTAENVWRKIAARAGGFILSERAQPIIETLSKVAIEAAK